jgi:integrase
MEDIRAFSLDEMNAIIEAYEISPTVSHWADFVKFLFYTGCRPGEAAALRWKHVSADCKFIKFSQSYDCGTRITKNTKTGTIRTFPCHSKLQALLLKIRPDDIEPESLVFLAKKGSQISWSTFHKTWKGVEHRGLKSIIESLVGQGKVRQYLKPYATRHTFITHMVNSDVPAHVIAAWVGNSPDMIWKHYYEPSNDYTMPEM